MFSCLNMFACLNCAYYMYGIFLKPHNLLVLSCIKALYDKQFQCLKGFTALLNVWAAGPCNKSVLTKNKGSGERELTIAGASNTISFF